MTEVFSAGTAEGTEDALQQARDGDDAAFSRLVEPLRRELHAHCYRMLGSSHDADDALQDALLRAWRGRAALVLFEVLGFSAAEIAEMMATSTASVNSALQRARAIVADRMPARTQQRTAREVGDVRLRELADAYAAALRDGDADALVALLTEDVTWSMPPLPGWYAGLAAVTDFAVAVPLGGCGYWRYRLVSANGQPAVAFYLAQDEAGPFTAWSITVLTVRDAAICELTSFLDAEQFAAFGLPPELPDPAMSNDDRPAST